MVIVARTETGREFCYSTRSAHKVARKDAEKIAEMLTLAYYHIKDGQKWYVYEIDEYDASFDYATMQRFYIDKSGNLKRRGYDFGF